MNIDIRPGDGVGPVKLGMPRSQVQAVMQALPGAMNHADSRGKLDYYFGNSFQIEYDKADLVHFIGVSYHPGCGCTYSCQGRNLFDIPAEELFQWFALMDGEPQQHTFNRNEYLFPNIIVTLWGADTQYDYYGGETREVYAQVGIGNASYLRACHK